MDERNIYMLDQNNKILDACKEELGTKRVEFEEENKELIEKIKDISEKQDSLKEDIKLSASVEFEKTGNKKLFGGIGIRVGSSLIYEDSAALEWAKKHELCLSLDKRAFEQLAKTQNLDFVKQEEKVTVTFPKALKLPNPCNQCNGKWAKTQDGKSDYVNHDIDCQTKTNNHTSTGMEHGR